MGSFLSNIFLDPIQGSGMYTVLGDTNGFFYGYLAQPSDSSTISLWSKWLNTNILNQFPFNLNPDSLPFSREEEINLSPSKLISAPDFNIVLKSVETESVEESAATSTEAAAATWTEAASDSAALALKSSSDCEDDLWTCLDQVTDFAFKNAANKVSKKFNREKYFAGLVEEGRVSCRHTFKLCGQLQNQV